MALIDVECASGHVSEVYRAAADWPQTPPCPDCGAETQQIHLPKRVSWTPDPVLVFKAPDGTYRFPGDPSGLSVRQYERHGYERLEIRGAAEMRRFESQMNRAEYSRAMRKAEHAQQAREAQERETRSELRSRMQSFSTFGRELAREAMRRNDAKPRERAREAGFVSEVYSYDRSSRGESRGPDGRRRRD